MTLNPQRSKEPPVETVVKNTYKNNPAKLAEWTTAIRVEKHTPVPHAKPVTTPATTPAK